MKIRIISLILSLICMFSVLSGCANQEKKPPSLDEKMKERVFDLEWDGEACEKNASLTKEKADELFKLIDSIENEYPYAHLYETDKALERLSFDSSVEEHKHSATDKSGKLTASALVESVKKNNEDFLASKPFGYKNVEDSYLKELCTLIIETIEKVLTKYPDIDKKRVYCNLGNLKILYDTGMLDFAQVTDKWVLAVNNLTASMAQTLKGEGAYRNTIIHESMHIIQIGCECEEIGENAGRRCGICVYWDDWDLNSADWGWFFEASAERNASNLTNADPMTYTYWVDYLCSFDMAVILDKDNSADVMETVCFYDDPEILFSAFGIETDEEKKELINALVTINVLQTSPEAFLKAYEAEYGKRPDEDEKELELYRYSLKPCVTVTLAKRYYKNLIQLLTESEVSVTDLCFLINAFESQINQHLSYSKKEIAEINEHFFSRYIQMRNALFGAIGECNGDVDMNKEYSEYDMCAKGKTKLNAALAFLSEEKRRFFLERCQWQYNMDSIGVKVESHE